MPFAMNAATQYINPTKTLEYLASGKPVVSTAVPDVVRQFTDVVDVAHSTGDFVANIGRVLDEPDPERIAAGIARASASSWESIVGAMENHMLVTLSRKYANEYIDEHAMQRERTLSPVTPGMKRTIDPLGVAGVRYAGSANHG
jgi:hypothetical protein